MQQSEKLITILDYYSRHLAVWQPPYSDPRLILGDDYRFVKYPLAWKAIMGQNELHT